jgi:hypothetical protein
MIPLLFTPLLAKFRPSFKGIYDVFFTVDRRQAAKVCHPYNKASDLIKPLSVLGSS